MNDDFSTAIKPKSKLVNEIEHHPVILICCLPNKEPYTVQTGIFLINLSLDYEHVYEHSWSILVKRLLGRTVIFELQKLNETEHHPEILICC